jgi:hypothetical protein
LDGAAAAPVRQEGVRKTSMFSETLLPPPNFFQAFSKHFLGISLGGSSKINDLRSKKFGDAIFRPRPV